MRVSTTCKCGEEVFFEIDTLAINVPSDLYSITDRVREECGEVSPELIDEELTKFFEGKEMKKLRFFQKCSKCGCENVWIFWVPLN